MQDTDNIRSTLVSTVKSTGNAHGAEVGVVGDVSSDVVVFGAERHDEEQRVARLLPDAALAVHIRDEQREHEELGRTVVRRRVVEELEEPRVLRHAHAQLVQQEDHLLLHALQTKSQRHRCVCVFVCVCGCF